MSCNLGKTRTRFTVNSPMFVILFWFLVENFKLSARTKDARDTLDGFLESVYPCVALNWLIWTSAKRYVDSNCLTGYKKTDV